MNYTLCTLAILALLAGCCLQSGRSEAGVQHAYREDRDAELLVELHLLKRVDSEFEEAMTSLDSDSWHERESAAKKLVSFGALVIPSLEKKLEHVRNPEVKTRLQKVLATIWAHYYSERGRKTLIRYIRIASKIDDCESIKLLLGLIHYPDRSIGREVAMALRAFSEKSLVRSAVDELVRNAQVAVEKKEYLNAEHYLRMAYLITGTQKHEALLKSILSRIPAWPCRNHDARNTGRSPFGVNVSGEKKWEYEIGHPIECSPTIGSDGTVYVVAEDRKMYVLDSFGRKKWQFGAPDYAITTEVTLGTDGTLYAGECLNLLAITAEGAKKWEVYTQGGLVRSPVVGNNGTIYFGSQEDKKQLVAVNPDGTVKWQFDTGEWVEGTPAIGEDETVYFQTSYSRSFPRLWAVGSDRKLKWRYQFDESSSERSPSVGQDGTVYISSSNKILALYKSGDMKWCFDASAVMTATPSIGFDGTVYIGSLDNCLYALSPDGSLKWKFRTNGSIRSSASIGADGTVYFGSDDHNLYALDPDGSLKWKFSTGAEVVASPAIGIDGTVYIGSCDGKVYAVGNEEGN